MQNLYHKLVRINSWTVTEKQFYLWGHVSFANIATPNLSHNKIYARSDRIKRIMIALGAAGFSRAQLAAPHLVQIAKED